MVRVPTYASYMSLLNQTMNTKSMLCLLYTSPSPRDCS